MRSRSSESLLQNPVESFKRTTYPNCDGVVLYGHVLGRGNRRDEGEAVTEKV